MAEVKTVLSESRIMDLAFANLTEGQIRELSYESWKDGIDITMPTVELVALSRAIESAVLAAITPVQVDGWLPISSAPKDGKFLVYMPEENKKYQVMYAHPNVTTIGNAFAFDLSKPTHWMPLPAAPSPTQAIEAKNAAADDDDHRDDNYMHDQDMGAR